MVERTRRRVLATGVAGLTGLAGLAGCGSLPLEGSEAEPDLNARKLRRIGRQSIPSPPRAFPVSVDRDIERHRERARELLARVPEEPSVPNGAVTGELRERRAALQRQLTGDTGTASSRLENWSALDRLDEWRGRRTEAAALLGAYRAATGTLDPAAVAERRDSIQTDLADFRRAWQYGGTDPASALVVHAAIERLVGTVARTVDPWPVVPSDPRDAPFEAGEVVGEAETARAALADAMAIRSRFETGSDAWTSRAHAIGTASESLRRSVSVAKERVEGSLDAEVSTFDRDIADTPAANLFRNAKDAVEWRTGVAEDARTRGRRARATLAAAESLVAVESFERIVDAIRDGRYGRVETVATVRDQRERAVRTLRSAWETRPHAVAVELTESVDGTLAYAHRELTGEGSPQPDVKRAVANFALVASYASFVPAATRRLVDVLSGEGTTSG